MHDHGRLSPFVPGRIWTLRVPLSFYGIPMGARMTVVRMRGGSLWLHSPVRLTRELAAELAALGPVQFVIAPNRLHHLHVADYVRAYPEAQLYGSPGLPKKRPDLPFQGVLENEPEPEWIDEIDQVPIGGSSYLDEVVFLDREAGVLIVADLLECATREDPWLYRWAARLAGTYGKPGLTRDQRFLLRDRAAARASIERILRWPFDRIVMAHGPLIEFGGKALFREAFDWLT